MTIHYSSKLSNYSLKGLFGIMFFWKGSVYKLIAVEFILFVVIYFTLSICYHFFMDEYQRDVFETIAKYCNDFSSKLPLSFVLGFFASTTIKAFFAQTLRIVWPEDHALMVAALIVGNDEWTRMVRRNIVRYVFLGNLFLFCTISRPLARRFPDIDACLQHGLVTEKEKEIYERTNRSQGTYFIPYNWAAHLVLKARARRKITSEYGVECLIDMLNNYRGQGAAIMAPSDMNIPLAYTQVVIIAVMTFYAACLVGRHRLASSEHSEFFFPFMTFAQIAFFMGWLKVSLAAINGFGENEDDLEFMAIADTYLQECYNIVDYLQIKKPELYKDKFWGSPDMFIPYTPASLKTMTTMHLGSMNKYSKRNLKLKKV